jgi:hypothetical protein
MSSNTISWTSLYFVSVDNCLRDYSNNDILFIFIHHHHHHRRRRRYSQTFSFANVFDMFHRRVIDVDRCCRTEIN